MVGWVKVACVSLGLVFCAQGLAIAQTASTHPIKGKFDTPTPGLASAEVYASTLAPLGYVDFCARGEMECQFSGGRVEPLAVTADNWNTISATNRFVNTQIRAVSDPENYHVPDYWTYPVDSGDCEDYVLLKKRYLTELGVRPETLLITVVLDENREGHAVLTVVTDKGDYILDNRRSEILRWDETGYIFLKRQSQAAAKEWISLQKSPTPVMVSTRSRSFLAQVLNLHRASTAK